MSIEYDQLQIKVMREYSVFVSLASFPSAVSLVIKYVVISGA